MTVDEEIRSKMDQHYWLVVSFMDMMNHLKQIDETAALELVTVAVNSMVNVLSHVTALDMIGTFAEADTDDAEVDFNLQLEATDDDSGMWLDE